MKRIAIIGAGISGVSLAKMLQEGDIGEVVVFEKNRQAGGLLACEEIDGHVFHKVGGHVFNSKNPHVLEWFWSQFDKEKEFRLAKRNAQILVDGQYIGYPIENHLSKLPEDILARVVEELLTGEKGGDEINEVNFGHYLRSTFGQTLYNLYFEPYNRKIWNCDLHQIPLAWLDGKLPMPNIRQIVLNNLVQAEEKEMVHATFYYPKQGGSQFIIDRLAKGLDIRLGTAVENIGKTSDGWSVNKDIFDVVVYSADVRQLGDMYEGRAQIQPELDKIRNFRSTGVLNVFCETDVTPISWLYLPDPSLKAYRIIYTGQFSQQDLTAKQNRSTCVVAFSGQQDRGEIREELKKLPGNLKELAYNYEPNAYVIQETETRKQVAAIKAKLSEEGFYLAGRFAEWEYYNMDKCLERAMDVKKEIVQFLNG